VKAVSLSRMIYTPKARIPIGEAIKLPDGTHALRVKKPGEDKYDEIPLEALLSKVVMSTERGTTTDREPPQCRHPSPSTNSSI